MNLMTVSTLYYLYHSAFTERPWLQQLDIARTLARRNVQNMGCNPEVFNTKP